MIYVYGGAANEKIFRDLHVLDTTSMSWVEPPTSGLPPGPLFGHSAELVGQVKTATVPSDPDPSQSRSLPTPSDPLPTSSDPFRPLPIPSDSAQCVFIYGGCREVVRHGTYASLHGRTHASSKLHVLDTGTMTWSKPDVAGNKPLPRYRHATAMHGSLMFMFGGLGGGADLFALDTGIVDESKAEKDPMKKARRRGGVRDAASDGSGNELIAWLEGLGLGKYTRVFVRQVRSPCDLPAIST